MNVDATLREAEAELVEARSQDGTVVRCEVLGAGRNLLVVHGSTADRTRWAPVREQLAERFRVHLMDRRGRGLSSDEADGPYALEREAEDIRALVATIGGPVRVLVHSYGGACALEAATACEGIERMLVYEPAFATETGPVGPPEVFEEVAAAVERGDREGALVAFFRGVIQLDDEALAALRSTPIWQARLAAAHTLSREGRAANAYRPDRGRLASITAPVRFLLGTETTPGLRASTLTAHAALPGSELRELRGHGHVAIDADPAMFVAEVSDWLGRPG